MGAWRNSVGAFDLWLSAVQNIEDPLGGKLLEYNLSVHECKEVSRTNKAIVGRLEIDESNRFDSIKKIAYLFGSVNVPNFSRGLV